MHYLDHSHSIALGSVQYEIGAHYEGANSRSEIFSEFSEERFASQQGQRVSNPVDFAICRLRAATFNSDMTPDAAKLLVDTMRKPKAAHGLFRFAS